MGGLLYKPGLISESAFADLSLVIITLDEAENLPELLGRVPNNVEIIILDSGSQDETPQIAAAFGARFEHRAFDNFASQKNFAMSLATRRWTLCLDADEVPDDNLWRSIATSISSQSAERTAFKMRRRLVFMGRQMKFGRTRDSVVRLFGSHTASYKNEIHETLTLSKDKIVRTLDGTLWHYSYKNLDDYFAKFNRYTSMMAASRWRQNKAQPNLIVMAVRLPADFIIRYVFKLGFLDGWPGYLWASLSSFYSLIKYAKLKELSEKVAK